MHLNRFAVKRGMSTFRSFSTSFSHNEKYRYEIPTFDLLNKLLVSSISSCKLLVVGCGTGGCSVAAKFARNLKKNELIVLEPSKNHYYQPLFTLVGGGIHTIDDAKRSTKEILPSNCTLIETKALEYSPEKNQVLAENGDVIEYDYLLVAVGLETCYHKVCVT